MQLTRILIVLVNTAICFAQLEKTLVADIGIAPIFQTAKPTAVFKLIETGSSGTTTPSSKIFSNICQPSPCRNGGTCISYLRHGVQLRECRCTKPYYGIHCEEIRDDLAAEDTFEVVTQGAETIRCDEPLERGNCNAYWVMYYYSKSLKKCASFVYTGCQGNGNKFDTLEECQNLCENRRTIIGKPDSGVCKLSQDFGVCEGSRFRWYYSTASRRCTLFIYSGCGGNENNFRTKTDCEEKCTRGDNGDDDNDVGSCSNFPCKNGGTCRQTGSFTFTCSCPSGFFGTTCSSRRKPCDNEQCKNGARCLNIGSSDYFCQCISGYSGRHCDVAPDHDPCDNLRCSNGGTCFSSDGVDAECACTADFKGNRCQLNVNPCTSHPCQHGGTCIRQGDDDFVCACSNPYTGFLCEDRDTDSDQCLSNPCRNGGRCIEEGNGEFRCRCRRGYTGELCDKRVACLTNPCQNGGTCVDRGDGRFRCRCRSSYSGNLCQLSSNPCRSNPCQNWGTCVRTGGDTFKCECKEQFTGLLCQDEVEEEKDECDSNPCENGGICEIISGRRRCKCRIGYTGSRCQSARTRLMEICADEEEEISCQGASRNKRLFVSAIYYGREDDSEDICPGRNDHRSCSFDEISDRDLDDVKDDCDGERSCAIRVGDRNFGPDPCRGVPKYARVLYVCR